MDNHPSVKRLNKLVNLNLIDLGNNAKKQQIFGDIMALLKIKLSEFPPNHNAKHCNDFLVYICNLIEEITKNDKKPNKKEIVMKLYKHLFNSDENELNDLSVCAPISFVIGLNCVCISKIIFRMAYYQLYSTNY
jgi:hypothetical protein